MKVRKSSDIDEFWNGQRDREVRGKMSERGKDSRKKLDKVYMKLAAPLKSELGKLIEV